MKKTRPKKVEALYAKLGKLIAERRLQVGLTQEGLARKIKLSRPAVANMEVGRQRIMPHQLAIIEKALAWPPGKLMRSTL